MEAETTTGIDTGSVSITESQASVIATITDKLDTDTVSQLDIYEGELTGEMYVSVGDGYQRTAVNSTGLTVTAVQAPDEELTQLAQLEPDPGETVADAVDSLAFAGD